MVAVNDKINDYDYIYLDIMYDDEDEEDLVQSNLVCWEKKS